MSAREMVDSGVEWIGAIPKGWDIVRLRSLALIETGSMNTDDREDNGIYPLYVRSKTIEKSNKYTHDTSAILVPGEGLIGEIFHLATGKHAVHQRVYSIQPYKGNFIKYIRYFMIAGFGTWAKQNSNTVTVESLRRPTFLNFILSLPPLSEQQSIANFLDHHVNLIDCELSLIDKKMELLGEKRKALIFECVTGKRTVVPRSSLTDTANVVGHGDWVAVPTGNDNLMDSGVDWIGAIPKDWIVNQLKNIVTVQVGKTPNTSNPENFDGGIPWITISDLNDDGTFPVFTKNTLSKHGSKQLKISPKGSILVSFKLSVGKAIIAQKDIYTNEAIATLSFKNLRSNDFLYWSVPDYFYNEASENIYGAKILNQDKIYRIKIVLPSVNEQNLISIFLSQETKIIDREISLLKLKKNLLAEKRRALIFEAVTGKIDCRSWTV